jgi:chlorobactene glucosyltransferase
LTGWLPAIPWILVLILVLYRYATRSPLLRDYPPRPTGPLISVVIPARNEAVNIADCVRSIRQAAYTPLEIIVVDDRSSDETAALAEAVAKEGGAPVTVIRGAELPDEWYGKPWALVQGYRAARGELLLFADADTRHTPELIPRAARALEVERVDLVSVLPRQEMGSFWEWLLQPQVFLVLAARVGDLRRVNRTRRIWDAISNGQFILTTRRSYESVGTHAVVRHSVIDDLLLAQEYVRRGRDIFLVHATEFMRTRMYRSLREIVEGWSKNLALGTPLMMPPIPVLRRLVPWLMWTPSLAWLAPPFCWTVWGWPWAAAATIASLLVFLEVDRREGAPPVFALLYPVGAVVVAFIMLRSALRGRRKVVWRGRVYSQ